MFFIKENSVSSRQDESKFVALKKLRFTARDSAKKIQPQQRTKIKTKLKTTNLFQKILEVVHVLRARALVAHFTDGTKVRQLNLS